MGTYTQLYFKGIVKNEYIPSIFHVVNFDDIEMGNKTELNDYISNPKILEEFEKFEHKGNIYDVSKEWYTTGVDCFMKFSKIPRSNMFIGNKYTRFNPDTGELRLVGDIKNYEHTYEEWIELSTKIMESVYACATHYEYNEYVRLYIFNKNSETGELEITEIDEDINDMYDVNDEDDIIAFMGDDDND